MHMQHPDDLDYVRRMMNAALYGNRRIESEEIVKNKMAIASRETLDKEIEQFEKGYNTLLTEIGQQAVEGCYQYGDDDENVMIEECLINDEVKSKIVDKNRWQKSEDEEELKLTGYSQEALLAFYHATIQLHAKALYERAIYAFHFLCRLAPQVSSFWLGLGLSLEANLEYMEALNAFARAIQAQNAASFTPFLAMIHCSIQIKNFTQVKECLEQHKENVCIVDDVKNALAFIENTEHKDM